MLPRKQRKFKQQMKDLNDKINKSDVVSPYKSLHEPMYLRQQRIYMFWANLCSRKSHSLKP